MNIALCNRKLLLDGTHAGGYDFSSRGKHVILFGAPTWEPTCVGTSVRHGCRRILQLEIVHLRRGPGRWRITMGELDENLDGIETVQDAIHQPMTRAPDPRGGRACVHRLTVRVSVPVFACLVLLLASGPLSAEGEDLNTDLMRAAVKIGHDKSTGTGFFLWRPDPREPERGQFVLVMPPMSLRISLATRPPSIFATRNPKASTRKRQLSS